MRGFLTLTGVSFGLAVFGSIEPAGWGSYSTERQMLLELTVFEFELLSILSPKSLVEEHDGGWKREYWENEVASLGAGCLCSLVVVSDESFRHSSSSCRSWYKVGWPGLKSVIRDRWSLSGGIVDSQAIFGRWYELSLSLYQRRRPWIIYMEIWSKFR